MSLNYLYWKPRPNTRTDSSHTSPQSSWASQGSRMREFRTHDPAVPGFHAAPGYCLRIGEPRRRGHTNRSRVGAQLAARVRACGARRRSMPFGGFNLRFGGGRPEKDFGPEWVARPLRHDSHRLRLSRKVLRCAPDSARSGWRGAGSRSRRTSKSQIDRAAKLVNETGGKLLGFVLNKRRYPIPRWLYRLF